MLQTCGHCCTKINNLSVRIGQNPILENINLHLNCRELLALIGPNGAGKTTLLKALLGELHSTGRVQYTLKGSKKNKPRIGYVPQKLQIDPDTPISVLDLIASAIRAKPVWLKIGKSVMNDVMNILRTVSAENLINRRIGELSGGELQRVLLAAAMHPVPDLLLLDEPVSAVDVKGLFLFYDIVAKLKREHDISIIMATHDIAGIAPHADRMILLNRTIVADGTPREIFSNQELLKTFPLSLWNISSLSTNSLDEI